jgi:rhodanese-related sulfurtransferase
MFSSVSMQEFSQKLNKEKINIIDVRENYEFVDGHVPNAKNIPLSSLQNDYKKLDKDKVYYVICYSGSRSKTAAQYLSKLGYNVINVLGGTSSYIGKLEY